MKRHPIILLIICILTVANTVNAQKAASLQDLFSQVESEEQVLTIFTAKEVVTMASTGSSATAVAVKGDRIVDVGSKEVLLEKYKSYPGKRIDESFSGHIIYPGLIDPHLHFWLFALVSNAKFIAPADWDLPWGREEGVVGQKEYLQRLKDYESSLEPGEPLFTWGYHQYFHGELTRDILDKEISSTRPILIWQRSVHEMIFNTAALDLMGMKESDWEGKGESSEMANWKNGHVWEKGLYLVVGEVFPLIANKELFEKGLERTRSYVHSGGITACADPGVQLSEEMIAQMIQILEDGLMPYDYYLIPAGNSIYDHNGKDAAETVRMVKEATKTGGEHIIWEKDQVKLFTDGAVFSQLMQMKDGYLDGHDGEWIQSPEDFADCAQAFWKEGYQIIVHVNGDMGMEVAVGVLDTLQNWSPRYDHRFRIDHFAYSEEAQVSEAAKLGALISSNPFYIHVLGEQYSKVGVGPERSEVMVRGRTVLDHGTSLSFHSDAPMAPARPMLLVWSAVNRLGLSGEHVLGPQEKVTPYEAMRAVTIDAAFHMNKEDEIGSIEIGKKANFTIFEENPLEVDPMRLKDIAIWGTVFEGEIYPIETQAQGLIMDEKNQKILAELNAHEHSHSGHHQPHAGCACETNQILQEVSKTLDHE